MLNSILKTVVKLAVLVALVKFVILPMIPSLGFSGFHFPSVQDLLKDPLKAGKELIAQLPKPPNAPDLGQAGRDADQARLDLERKARELSPFK